MTKVFLSAGDLSGDIHCALLIEELRRQHPDWDLYALGGPHMEAAGAKLIGNTAGLGVIGFAAALATLPRSLKLKKIALQWLEANRPDAVVLCDWGGFNGRILPDIKRLELPVLYYFPPRSWQKHGEGGLAVAQSCDLIATPFPWSAERLKNVGGKAEWVGHPLLETVRPSKPVAELRAEFGSQPGRRLLALMPGSRALELSSIAPHVAEAAKLLQAKFPDLDCVLAAPKGGGHKLRSVFPESYPIVEGRTADVLLAADAAIVKSGTSTLEAAVADVPQVIVYDIPALLRAQVRLTGLRKKVPFVGMPNIILEHGAVPELLGDDCRGPKIVEAVSPLLEGKAATQMREAYTTVRQALGEDLPYTATVRTAALVAQLVGAKR